MSSVTTAAATATTPIQTIHFLHFIEFPLVYQYLDAPLGHFAVRGGLVSLAAPMHLKWVQPEPIQPGTGPGAEVESDVGRFPDHQTGSRTHANKGLSRRKLLGQVAGLSLGLPLTHTGLFLCSRSPSARRSSGLRVKGSEAGVYAAPSPVDSVVADD